MKKSLLFFVGIMVMILGSTIFVSCSSNDDDTPEKKEEVYTFSTTVALGDDILKIYDNVTITLKYPDGMTDVQPIKVNGGTATYDSKKDGNVVVEINGTLKTDIVEDDKSYDVSISYGFRSNTGGQSYSLTHKTPGIALKEKYKELSSLAGFKHTF